MIAASPTATVWRLILLVLVATLAVLALGHAAGPLHAVATPRSTSLSLSAPPDTLVYGRSTTLTATLSRAGPTQPVAGQWVQLEARRPGTTTWSRIGAATTTSNGRAVLTATPKRHTEYRAVFGGTADWAASRSRTRTVRPAHPRQKVLLQRHTSDGWKTADEQALTTSAGSAPGTRW